MEGEHDQYEGECALQKVEIYPGRSMPWNFTLLSAFLNELGDFKKPKRRFLTTNETEEKVRKFVFHHQENVHFFYLRFYLNCNIGSSISCLDQAQVGQNVYC